MLDALGSSTRENLQELVQASIIFCHYVDISGAGSQQAIELSIEKLHSVKFSTVIPSSPPSPPPHAAQNKSFLQKGFVFAKARTVKPGLAVKGLTLKASLKLQANCLGCLSGSRLRSSPMFQCSANRTRVPAGRQFGHGFLSPIQTFSLARSNLR